MNRSSRALASARAGALAFALIAFATATHAQFLRMPQSGEVFRDYGRTMNGNRDWRVTDPTATAAGAAESLPNPILSIAVADLQGAIRAELIIDFWGGHPGTQPRQLRFNNTPWITIPSLATITTTRPNCFMQQVNFVVDIPLANLVEGTNTLEGTSGGQICNNFNWGQWGWYQVILRVYYDAATKPHPTGAITSPSAGSTFGDNPTVTASASSSAGVARVDVFAYFDGYDPDGDGRYADWQASYHRPLSATTPWMSEHVGSDSAAPFAVTWDTTLVPDQRPQKVKLIAHVRDRNGYVFVTDEVASLTLARTTASVRLYRGVGVPEVFWLRNNQTKSSYFVIPRKDDLAKADSARLLLRTWNGRQSLTTMLVNSWIAPLLGQDHHYSYDTPTLPASALQSGLNTFTASSTETEHHGTEIMWPGPALLVRYNTPPRPPTQLPAFFGFDEPSGETVVDASGNGNDGVIVAPGVTRTDSGRFGRGIQFDGTTGAVDLDVIEFPGSALTVSFWAYVSGTSATDARLFAKALSAQTLDGYCVVSLQDRTRVRFRLATESGVQDLVSASFLTVDAWNHVAVTYDGASMRIYVNGVQRASSAQTGAIANGSSVPVWLGDNPGPERRRLTGRIDELRLFNTAQTAADITALMNTAVADADTTPPNAPTALTAAALSSYAIALTWTAPADAADVSFYRVYRDGFEIGTTTTTSYRDSDLAPLTPYAYTVRAADAASNLSTPSAPAPATTLASRPPPDAPWWHTAWPYRAHLRAGSADWPRSDRVVDVTIDLTALLASAGTTAIVDITTLRLVEVALDGRILDAAVPFQFDPAAGFDPATNARGTLVFRLTGATPAGIDRHYHLYFAAPGSGATPLALTPEVVVTDNITDEGQSSFRVVTPTGTFFYHKPGGGFSSWIDTGGNDWIGYHPTGGSAGNYRGIPNAVHPEGHFHPGATTSQSTLAHSGPLKATLHSITTDGLWECTWEIYGRNARLTMTRAAANFWFLYEGTPGGTLQPASDLVIRSSGATSLASQSWTEDLAGDEWVSFSDPGIGRSLYTALHQPDIVTDSYWPMDARMTVFGFGRNNLTSYLSGTPKTFTIGLVDSVDFGALSLEIASATKDVITSVTTIEAPAAGPLVSDDFRAGYLDTDHWTFIDPVGDGGGQITNQRLALSVPAGSDHDLWTSGIRSPHVVQTVGNTDFEVEAKFESTPSQQYQMQGFIAQQDGTNFLRFEVHSDGTGIYAFAATLAGGTSSTKARVALASAPTYYLRLGRVGSMWTFSYSYDGATWANAATFNHALALTKLGVFAGNSGGSTAPAFTALVDYVFNTTSPIVPEDSQGTISVSVTGEGSVTKNPDQALYDVGQVVQLSALAAPGWLFNQWSGAASGTANPLAVTVTGNHNLVAEFTPEANTAPTLSSVAAQTTDEDVSTGSIPFTVGDAETDPAALVVTGTSSDSSLVPNENITFGGTGTDRTLTLTPLPDRSGTATITLSVSDGRLTTNVTFALTVTPVNDAPTLSPIPDQTIYAGGDTGPIAFAVADDATAPGEIACTASSSNPTLVPDANIIFGGTGADRTVTVTPAAGQTGTATITVTVADGELTAERSFLLTVRTLPSAFVSDDFSGAAFDSARWSFINPVGDGTLSLLSNTLHLHVPGGVDHDIWGSGNRAPRIMQAVDNLDFEVEVKFESALTRKFQLQGLIVQQDDANFLRIEVLFDGASVRAFAASFVNGSPTTVLNKKIAAAATYFLRIARSGTQWTYRYSYDGDTWTTAGTFTRSLAVSQIGVHAGNASGTSSPEFTAVVDYVFNTAAPIEPEDAPVVNTAPAITGLAAQTIDEDTAAGPLAFTINDAETAAELLAVTTTSANQALLPDSGIIVGGSGANRTLTLTPLPNQTGSATVTVNVSDGQLSSTETLLLTATPVDDPPTVSAIADQTVSQDRGTGPIPFTVDDVDTPAGDLTVNGDSSNPTLVPTAAIVFGGSGADRTVSITPAAGQTGTATITLAVYDAGHSASTPFTLTVTPVSPDNSAPTISAIGDQVITEDGNTGPLAFSIADVETPTDDLRLTVSSSNPVLVPDTGIVLAGSGENRSLTVTPQPDAAGNATITITVSDAELSTSAVFLLTVDPMNDAPSVSPIADQTVAPGGRAGPLALTINDKETAADALVLTATSSDPFLVADADIAFGGGGANRTLTIQSAAGESGSATITVTVDDGELSTSESFLVTVQAVARTFVSDDFRAATLDSSLWTFVNPVGDGTVSLTDKTLRIHVPGGVDHDIWAAGNRAPRVMQPIDDVDFEVEVKFESAVTLKFQSQGLIIQQDATNFLRIEVYFDGTRVRAFGASFVNGSPSVVVNRAIAAASSYYLRISRTGSLWTYLYSYDGVTWTTAGTFTRILALTEIGVHAGNASGSASPDFTAVVDYAFNTVAPITPEDPTSGSLTIGINGNGTVTKQPDQATYGVGDAVVLRATPAPGWTFAAWGGDVTGNANPLSVTIEGDHRITALFTTTSAAAPTISALADQTVLEDSLCGPLSFTVADADTSPAALVVTAASSDSSLVPAENIVVSGSDTDRTVSVTPAANQNGNATISLTVSDGQLTATESFLLTVTPVNDAPSLAAIADQTITEGTSTVPIPVAIGDADTALANLVLTGRSSNPALVPDENLTFAGSGSERTLTITPAPGQTGSATITVTASDGIDSVSTSFALVVQPAVGALVSDDFSSGTVNPARWSVINPRGDASIAASGTLLRIDIPGGLSHDAWTTNQAPRVMQPIADTDFGIEAKFISRVEQTYQMQGLLIEQDSGNFLRFSVHYGDAGVRLFAAAFINATASVKLDAPIATGSAFFLRVARSGNQWVLTYSVNGTDWLPGVTFTQALAVAQAGVFAGNSGSGTSVPAFTGLIDYVFNTASPIVPEDSAKVSVLIDSIGSGTVTRAPDQSVYDLGSSVQLTANAASGSAFVGWSGGVNEAANPVTLTLTEDVVATATFATLDPSSDVIDVWYGSTQTFGQIGVPQQWVNVLGNLVVPSEVAELSYYLNGAFQGRLSVGPTESDRLVEAGDFNAEIDYTHLGAGANQVMFVAERFDGTVIVKATTVNFAAGNTWPLPYAIDWSTSAKIQDVAQITDGRWSLVTDGVRTAVRGYDRVLAFGDMVWTNYEVTVPFTLHSVNSNQFGACVGIVTRWIGHFDWDGSQPRWGWHPNGAIGGIMWRSNSSTPLIEIQPNGLAADQSLPIALSFGTRYQLKMQVETQGTPEAPLHVHRLKLWIDGNPEPSTWTLVRTASTGLDAGSALLLAHNVDVTFGNVTVHPLTP